MGGGVGRAIMWHRLTRTCPRVYLAGGPPCAPGALRSAPQSEGCCQWQWAADDASDRAAVQAASQAVRMGSLLAGFGLRRVAALNTRFITHSIILVAVQLPEAHKHERAAAAAP